MAALKKSWKVEYAKTGRSFCRTCQKRIGEDVLRLGKVAQARRFDGLMHMWNHATCVMKKKSKRLKCSITDIEGIESLRWEDQQKIKEYIDSRDAAHAAPPPVSFAVQKSKTSLATCKRCSQKIVEGEVRVSTKRKGTKTKTPIWYHASCFVELHPSTLLENLPGWGTLSASDQASIFSATQMKASASTDTGSNDGGEPSKNLEAKIGNKRKNAAESGQPSKILKTDEADMKLESKLEAQTRALWDLKDDLKKHVSITELRDMLKANDQSTSGSEVDLRDRCADGMMFGALKRCPMCSGHLHCSGGSYRCDGYLTEWSKCTYSSLPQERVKGNWEIPEDTDNQYLLKWFESQKDNKPARLLPPPSSFSSNGVKPQMDDKPVVILPPSSYKPTSGNQTPTSGVLQDLRVVICGYSAKSTEALRIRLEKMGGQVHDQIQKDTVCLVAHARHCDRNMMKTARRKKIPVVNKEYLMACIRQRRKLAFVGYEVWYNEEYYPNVVTVRVKGSSAVHQFSGLQNYGHIFEENGSVYNTTLSMSDLATGTNSYYVLQIIEEDNSPQCYLFRKWGRVGNERIGGDKLEVMPKLEAIERFKQIFKEKTGNCWEAWVHEQNIQKIPGRFFPLDIDYGVIRPTFTNILDDGNSQLAPALKDLMKMLFSAETYRNAMRAFHINLSEMPLGKLSKTNIQKGFEALTHIENILENTDLEPSIREGLIVDASNQFFTVIPCIQPHVIRTKDEFMSKVKMLEALQEIEIASGLAGFADDDNTGYVSLDDKYKKLCCNIVPLPRNSEDYRLIEKYLLTTHAPTHTSWRLELEEVFALEREGESDRFAPYRQKLGNRMLLWHGSRLTNFLGILSQGLRVAPPEAPACGYMFGKGIYFADLVSKSAQYCCTDRRNTVGLMLLSEVALGRVHELKTGQYMEHPPEGSDSTKGLGWKVPDEAKYEKWRDEVIVPCGKPVDSNVINPVLMHNEYIVYNPAQVKMQFLLKVRFHY